MFFFKNVISFFSSCFPKLSNSFPSDWLVFSSNEMLLAQGLSRLMGVSGLGVPIEIPPSAHRHHPTNEERHFSSSSSATTSCELGQKLKVWKTRSGSLSRRVLYFNHNGDPDWGKILVYINIPFICPNKERRR